MPSFGTPGIIQTEQLQRVPRRIIKMIKVMENLTYEERLNQHCLFVCFHLREKKVQEGFNLSFPLVW